MRIDVIEREQNKKYGGAPAPAIKNAITELRTLTAQWQQKNYGKLEKPEQKMLSELHHRLGSLTPYTQVPRVNAFNVNGKISPRVIWIASAIVAAVLGVAGIFIPGPVLMMTIGIGGLVLLTGLLGFTMSRTMRLSAAILGLAMMIVSGWGLTALQVRTEAKTVASATNSNLADFDRDLKGDHVSEAMHKIGMIQQKLRATGSSDEQKVVGELKSRIDGWIRENFGELNPQERSTLLLLFGEFGSVTANSVRKFRSIKVADGLVSLTMAVAPKDVEENQGDKQGQKASVPAIKDAASVALYVVRHVEEVNALELKIVTAAPGEQAKDFRTINLDNRIIGELRNGNPAPFQQALSESSEKK